ncbi:MAG: RidA family protein [Candidatus Asgardarchaeia archaeon]
MSYEDKLKELGISLPQPSKPIASYVPYLLVNNIYLYISGQLPIKDGTLIFKGKLGADLTTDEGYQAAKICAINIIAQIKTALGSLDKVEQIVKLEGYVASTPEYTEHSKVINGASDLIFQVFGEAGKHTRIAVGVCSLPLNAPCEISALVKVKQ